MVSHPDFHARLITEILEFRYYEEDAWYAVRRKSNSRMKAGNFFGRRKMAGTT